MSGTLCVCVHACVRACMRVGTVCTCMRVCVCLDVFDGWARFFSAVVVFSLELYFSALVFLRT